MWEWPGNEATLGVLLRNHRKHEWAIPMAVRVILTSKLISYCAFSQWKTPLMASSLQHCILTLDLYLSGSISDLAAYQTCQNSPALQSNPTVVSFPASPHCKQQKAGQGLGRKLSDSCLPCNSVQCISQPLFQPQVQSIIGAHKRMKWNESWSYY